MVIEEQGRRGAGTRQRSARPLDVPGQGLAGHAAERDLPHPAALAGAAHAVVLQVDVLQVQRHEFGHAHAGGVEELQHGPIADRRGGGVVELRQQPVDLVDRGGLRQVLAHVR